ncbi:hypothetical protein BN903_37 [Halorubrum sp. AJ67]|nr:hypothetical protein BN903_37 [Halorubrum sp. AJ67]
MSIFGRIVCVQKTFRRITTNVCCRETNQHVRGAPALHRGRATAPRAVGCLRQPLERTELRAPAALL